VIYRTDREGNIIWVSPSAVNLLGCESVDDILGKNVTDFYLLPNEKKSFLEKLSVSGSVSDVDVSLGRYDGIKIIVSTSARYYKDDKGDIAGVEGICRDISSRKKAEDVLHLLSLTDELTGLYNRRGFFTLAEHHLKKIKRKGTKNFLFYADLDNLKGINDLCGHLEGDMAIKAFAEILKSTFRESDVIARIGGDEFVISPVPLTETEEGSIVRRLQDTLDSHNLNGEHEYRLSFSYGIAHCNPEMNCNIDELLASADELMYSHKNQKYD
jgi:diguanylate cyclase (GGDEF)-like protein/PAS domain S-box-containing protein